MTNINLAFAKVVATPTLHGWSQAYNAGSLFAILSLSIPKSAVGEEEILNPLGKDMLSTLEEEYFTLENKNLSSIKQALATTLQKVPENVTVCLAVASLPKADENILYVFSSGNGKILLKRGDQLGTVLASKELTSASGTLQDNDMLILATQTFSRLIPNDMLTASLASNNPSEVAEHLAPAVHEKEEGEATALILSYKDVPKETMASDSLEEVVETEKNDTHNTTQRPLALFIERLSQMSSRIPLPSSLNHGRKVILSLLCLLLLIFIASIFFALQKQGDAKTQALFKDVYAKATAKYEEGKSLETLNKSLARDDFQEAKTILEKEKDSFKPGSVEEKEINALLAQIELALSGSEEGNTTAPRQVATTASLPLQLVNENKSIAFTQDDATVYLLTNNAVTSVDKTTKKENALITNTNLWEAAGGIGIYNANLYILDKNRGEIYKFSNKDGDARSEYLAQGSYEFSPAVSMAIDGAVYVLSKDGKIVKFLRGNEETFSIVGLTKPLKNPTRIFTNVDADNLYILDNGNSRIVVLGKDGSYKTQYQASVLSSAQEFEVREKDLPAGRQGKTIFILSKGTVWQIQL